MDVYLKCVDVYRCVCAIKYKCVYACLRRGPGRGLLILAIQITLNAFFLFLIVASVCTKCLHSKFLSQKNDQ